MAANDAIEPNLGRLADDLNPLRVLALFQRIPDEDLDALDITGRPENLIVRNLAVPPVAIRPSVEMDGASNEDDVTMKLMQIVEVNATLRHNMEKGVQMSNIMESWDFLQARCGGGGGGAGAPRGC